MPAIPLHRRNVRGDRDALSTYFGPISGVGAGGDFVALNKIILYTGSSATNYNNTDAGLASAISAASSGDTIWIPPTTLTNNYTVPAGVTIHGESRDDVIFSGQITLSNGSVLENLSIVRSEDDAGAIYGIIEGSGAITAIITNVKVDVANATGAAYAVYMANGGEIDAYGTELLAETGSVGYAAYISSGDFYHYGGRAIGTTSLLPYFS